MHKLSKAWWDSYLQNYVVQCSCGHQAIAQAAPEALHGHDLHASVRGAKRKADEDQSAVLPLAMEGVALDRKD
jgi:hypothetical protein